MVFDVSQLQRLKRQTISATYERNRNNDFWLNYTILSTKLTKEIKKSNLQTIINTYHNFDDKNFAKIAENHLNALNDQKVNYF